VFGPQLWLNLVRAAKYLSAPELAGGMSRLDAIYAGMGGMETSQNPNDRIVHIRDDGTGKYGTFVEQRGQTGLYDSAQLYAIGQRQARMLPYAAGSAFRAAPTQIYAAYKPIHDLSQGAANQFRRQQLPRVTGLEGLPTLAEMVKDALNGARVGVGSLMPMPFGGPPKPYADLWWLLGQLWGRLAGPKKSTVPASPDDWTGAYDTGFGKYTWIYRIRTDGTRQAQAQHRIGSLASCSDTLNWCLDWWDDSNGDGTYDRHNHVLIPKKDYRGFELVPADPSSPTLVHPAPSTPIYTPWPQPEPIVPVGDAEVPRLPPLITPVTPAPQEPEPETDPEVAPVEPGPAKPPTTTPALPPAYTPVLPANPTGTKDGAIVPRPTDPVPVTDPDWHFPVPGKPPVVGNGPRPDLAEMAKELGRLEQKLSSMLNPVDSPADWIGWLEQVREALFNLVSGTTYTLTEECNPFGDPDYIPRSWEFDAPGALNAFGVIEHRIDALAKMVDQSLRAKQQVCLPKKPTPVGELVTINFIADEKPPGSSAYLRKQMRYRDSSGRPEADHVDHWLNFEWEAGPAIVRSRGAAWGEVCVWAASPDEGRRVITHAATIAQVNLGVKTHKWFDQFPRSPRYGRSGRMRVEHDQQGTPCISKRAGSSGRPDWALDS
jgi:hypothetical protein